MPSPAAAPGETKATFMRRCVASRTVIEDATARVRDEEGRIVAEGPALLTGKAPSVVAARVALCEGLWQQSSRQRYLEETGEQARVLVAGGAGNSYVEDGYVEEGYVV